MLIDVTSVVSPIDNTQKQQKALPLDGLIFRATRARTEEEQ